MKNLNGKQNLDLDFVKFYCTTDTIYADYTGLFRVSLLCQLCSLRGDTLNMFEMSHALGFG